jgi:transposase
MTDEITHKTFSQQPNPKALHNYLERNFPGGNYYSAYEAGFCGYWIHNQLVSLGINSIVVNPADIPTTNKETVQKEDKRDSRKIARSLRNGDLVPIYVPSLKTLEDRSLIRTRAALVKDLKRYKSRIKQFLHFHGITIPETFNNPQSHWSKRFINWLEDIEFSEESGKKSLMALVTESKNVRQSILHITTQVRELSRTIIYSDDAKLLQSIPGIGLLTSMTILTELETMNRFNNLDQLCGYIGFVPSTSSTGDKDVVNGITPRGHNILRSAIIESAWIAARTDPAMIKSYHDYCKRMEPNKAIVRISKKLLSRIRFVLINKQLYKYAKIK